MSLGDESREPTFGSGESTVDEATVVEASNVETAAAHEDALAAGAGSDALEGSTDGTVSVSDQGAFRQGELRGIDLTAPASTLTIRDAGELADASDSVPPSKPLERPTFVFLGIVSALTLAADIGTKAWAEVILNRRGLEPLDIIGHNLSITLAYNKGGAWGMFQDAGEMVRKPFFICVSIAAVWFIVSLYARLTKGQKALTWGLPLVLGGALGNLSDRITRSQVVDFIDYKADWVMRLNAWIRQNVENWTVTDHWPTFNVADIAICIGVGLMAVDMYTSRRRSHDVRPKTPAPPSAQQADAPSLSA